jgi:putative nucleotidyltransferase with HDIG domain
MPDQVVSLSYDDLTSLLLSALELRDPSAENHSNGVAALSDALAAKIGMEPGTIETLRYAAALHDIGKLAMSETVISKPSRLTRAEFLMMQQHTVLGHNLVQPLRFDPIIPDVILRHHENFDGSGYPEGLKGAAIPLAARLIRLADFYDALTEGRRYRDRTVYSHGEALELMQRNRNCFDPDLLAAFVEMMDARGGG